MTEKYDPRLYDASVEHTKNFLETYGWEVDRYGRESLPERFAQFLNADYDLTSLYVRTRPDLIGRMPDKRYCGRTFLIECKGYTEKVGLTHNYSVEAIAWVMARHLRKISVNYVYAFDDPFYGLRFFVPDKPPFSTALKIKVPIASRKLFEENIEMAIKRAFSSAVWKFEYINIGDPKASNDPFILIERKWLEQTKDKAEFARHGSV